MEIRDLGEISGDVLLFGGCYSNLQATTALLKRAADKGIGPENMIFTGDAVAYCTDGPAVIDLLVDSKCHVVAGNVEKKLAQRKDNCNCGFAAGTACDVLSAGWYAQADRTITDVQRDWMADLADAMVFTHAGKRYVVLHGGFSDVSRFIWPSSADTVFVDEIDLITAQIGPVDGVICGHSGLAFERVIDGVSWINAGAIGMPPHDGRSQTRYCVLSDQGARIERLEYDVAGAVDAMERAGLTQGYDKTLTTGIWPSEDVLPVQLRR
jgi:predicted phosphodiesterase